MIGNEYAAVDYDGFTIMTIEHDNDDTWFGIAISLSDVDRVIVTKHQITQDDADRVIREMVDAYGKMELTELSSKYLERTQAGCTVREIMELESAKYESVYAVLARLRQAGYVRSITEQIAKGVPGQRGRYFITDSGQKVLDTYLERGD